MRVRPPGGADPTSGESGWNLLREGGGGREAHQHHNCSHLMLKIEWSPCAHSIDPPEIR